MISQEALINVIYSRLGKRSITEFVAETNSYSYEKEWEDFMAGKDCSKVAVANLLYKLDVVIKYGDGSTEDVKKLAECKSKSEQEFLAHVNKTGLKTSIYKIKHKKSTSTASIEPINDWIPDNMSIYQQGDPYVALGID